MQSRTDDNYHESFLELCDTVYCFKGKDVLEVGGCELPDTLIKFKPKSWTAVDISDNRLSALNGIDIPAFYNFKKMDITQSSFKDNSFDYIYSLNCFEHISDLRAAFSEMYRILRPGGILFSKFGPIWSSPIGHHTWVEHNDALFHFNDNLFDHWLHLACSKDEFIQALNDKYPVDLLNKITKCVFDSNDINRLIDSDYYSIFRESDFNIILVITNKKGKQPGAEFKEKIMSNYPEIKNLRSSSFLLILSKGRFPLLSKFKIYKEIVLYFIRMKFIQYLNSATRKN